MKKTDNTDKELSDFSLRLVAMRKEKKETQQSLAKKTGISRSLIANWEHGTSKPNSDNLQKLLDFFNVNPDYFLHGKGGKNGLAVTANRYPVLMWQNVLELKKWIKSNESPINDYIFSIDKFTKNCFCLKIESDAMTTDKGAYSFPVGAMVVFEPIEKIEAKDGDFIIATKDDIVDFKQLSQDGFNKILRPLNKSYTPSILNDDIKIVAKAVKIEIYML